MEIGAILLAAGRGERLRPLTDTVAKAALPVVDVPLGAWGVAALKRVASSVLVNTSWLGGGIEAALDGPGVEFLDEGGEPYGTAGTLKALEDRVGARVVIHNCDLITDLQPAELLDAHRDSGAEATIAVVDVGGPGDVDHDGRRVTRFIDRRRERRAGAVYIGMAVIERSAIARLTAERPLGLGESLLRTLAEAGQLAVHPLVGYARDVGTPASYLRACRELLVRGAPAPPIDPPGRFIEVEGGVAYLSPGAAAAPGTLGHNAVVLDGAQVEGGAWVQDAIVWRGVRVSSGRTVTGAIALADRDLT